MSSTAETFVFTQKAECADADGVPIREGSVLREINDADRGVVVRIVRHGDHAGPFMSAVGDLCLDTGAGCTRVTNRYSQWRHVPREQQSYHERLLSWIQKPYDHEPGRGVSAGEARAADGIMALLPDGIVDWDYGPSPDTLENALHCLAQHLGSGSFPRH